MPLQAITSTEPIPGYRIRERIGAGGYGEVWTADAPGGLVKAIKFVYGFLNEDRASRELKALNRIKSVRHPFLLSLERIEVVDGQLLIVTELAEASLKERFDACREEGLEGIEHGELMRYMRDAADVLDYMNEEHSLQHLDIKPENLLMLAGRVKVADFGLVKDIHDATASMMGGLTPLYAPPEVFDGRPSRRSDQYSLAIVYQEMLTGELPFPGTTAMQLARQHMYSRPRLAALPEHDQAVIARALSKAPDDRFANCRELVDALELAAEEAAQDKASTPHDRHQRTGSNREETDRSYQTEVIECPTDFQLGDPSIAPVPRIDPAPTVRVLPPIELEDRPVSVSPVLFLGVGRSAGRIMLQLRRRFDDRFGGLDEIPAFQMLLLDTDGKDLLEVTRHRHGLKGHEVMSLPLRRPQDYRGESRDLLKWLSRRWLYNIPKSLKTEGLRPLGRLALVDHAGDVISRVQKALSAAADPEGLDLSGRRTELKFEESSMRVVVISSISGGTGSGIVIDLGYLVRHLLAQMELPDDNVTGILTHSTGRSPREMELAVVNTYATLCELNHYGRLGSHYPGDKICQLPARKEDHVAFRDTYLIDLGDGLNEQQFDDAAEKVASYLYLDTATAAADFFKACRDQEPRHPDTRNAEIPLRTCGIHQFSCLQEDIVDITVEHLCRHALERWMLGTTVSVQRPVLKRTSLSVRESAVASEHHDYNHLIVNVERFVESLQMDFDSLFEEMFRVLERELGKPADEFFRERLSGLPIGESAERPEALQALISQFIQGIDGLFGAHSSEEDHGRSEPGSLEQSVAPLRLKAAQKRAALIREWLLDMVDDETACVRGAKWLGSWLAEQTSSTEERVREVQQAILSQLNESERALNALQSVRGRVRERAVIDELPGLLEVYSQQRVNQYVVESVAQIVKTAKGRVSAVRDDLVDLERELRHISGHFDCVRTLDSLVADEDVRSDDLLESVGHILVDQVDTLTERFIEELNSQVLREAGGLRRLLGTGGVARNALPETLRSIARTTVIGVMKTLDVADVMFRGDAQVENDVKTLTDSLEAAKPRLLRCGGARRLLVVLPKGSDNARPLEILHGQMKEVPSVSRNNDGDFIICHEAEQISLTQAAVTIIGGRPDLADYAMRLHTRNDVSWSTLPDIA